MVFEGIAKSRRGLRYRRTRFGTKLKLSLTRTQQADGEDIAGTDEFKTVLAVGDADQWR